MSSELDPEVLRSFMEEARSYLPALSNKLNSLRDSSNKTDVLEEMHRLAHSIRGAGQMVGLRELAAVAAGLEELLAVAAAGETECDENLIEVIESGLQQMGASLAEPAASSAPVQPEEPEIQPEDIPGDLLDSFLEEAEEHLQIVGAKLQQAENRKDRGPIVREIRRSVHTIKGAAGMVGLSDIKSLAHRMEDLLDTLYENQREFTPDCYHLLASTYDTLCDMVSSRGRTTKFRGRVTELFALYNAILETQSGPLPTVTPQDPAPEQPAPEPEPEVSDPGLYVRVPFARLDALVRLVGELFVNGSVFEQHLASYGHEMDELDLNQARMRRIAGSMDNRCATFSPGIAGSFGDPRRNEFDALEFDRYTELHLLSRDLNEATSDLATISGQMKLVMSSFDAFLTRQGRLASELQDQLIRLRMVAFATLANRLHRTVRVSARKRGKEVDLVLDGVSTELDKTVMEQLAGPLEHLLRNAVDHGIEESSRRRTLGKPERGTIRIAAGYEGTQVVLRLSDDGAGLNFQHIRDVAVRLGYFNETEAAGLSSAQLQQLIFEPGFSTAETVSEISGRGVGLDVVKAGVEALKGTVSMDSREGHGVTFTIRLPMTLVITKVLMVEAQQERYAIPLAAVTRTSRIDSAQIEKCGHAQMVQLENRLLPVLNLAEWLELRGPGELPQERLPLVVVRAGEGEVAMIPDRILEAREVMVKPLDGLLRGVPRMAGATILGDGSVVLILNPVEFSGAQPERVKLKPRKNVGLRTGALEILIVDDSPSVRRAVANLVRSAGWVPNQAKDGVEALEILQRGDRRPDAILMDIEMPRMDGFELTSSIRAQPVLSGIPVVMLTSRSGDKHRRKAMEVGVNDYLVKPFQEEALLDAVRRCVAESRRTSQVA